MTDLQDDQSQPVTATGRSGLRTFCIVLFAVTAGIVLLVISIVAVGAALAGVFVWLQPTPEVDELDTQVPEIVETTKRDDRSSNKSITQWLVDHPIEEAERPIDPIIKVAELGLAYLDENISDYSATIVKQERVKDKVGEKEFLQCKIRHQSDDHPFSVYLKFVGPARVAKQEVIWVKGRNNGKLTVKPGGRLHRISPSLDLDPTGMLAMAGNRYPIHDIGLRNLVAKMLEKARAGSHITGLEIKVERNIKYNDHSATLIELKNPVKKPGVEYYLARVYIDDELNVPVAYEAFLWPESEGQDPPLLESYFYHDLKLNVGLTDEDFDRNNPDYKF